MSKSSQYSRKHDFISILKKLQNIICFFISVNTLYIILMKDLQNIKHFFFNFNKISRKCLLILIKDQNIFFYSDKISKNKSSDHGRSTNNKGIMGTHMRKPCLVKLTSTQPSKQLTLENIHWAAEMEDGLSVRPICWMAWPANLINRLPISMTLPRKYSALPSLSASSSVSLPLGSSPSCCSVRSVEKIGQK